MPSLVSTHTEIQPGNYYEDCAFHPCLCISSDDDEITGVSLVDGSHPRACSIPHCGVRRLTFEEALHWKFFGPLDQTVVKDSRWWYDYPNDEMVETHRL